MPETKILDGKSLAEKIRLEIRKEMIRDQLNPSLAIILIGDDPASHLFVSLKEKACQEVGIEFHKYLMSKDADQARVLEAINFLNKDASIDAILVQLPLPAQLNEDKVVAAIDPRKDVDGFHPENLKKLEASAPYIVPGVSLGILKLIEETKEPLTGKSALIIANNKIFARPLIQILQERGAKAEFIVPDAPSLKEKTRAADILIVATGRPNFINGDMIKEGAIIIDVGTNKVDAKVVGDVDLDSITDIAGYITPVPGGVGPMTIAMLLKNVVKIHTLRELQY